MTGRWASIESRLSERPHGVEVQVNEFVLIEYPQIAAGQDERQRQIGLGSPGCDPALTLGESLR